MVSCASCSKTFKNGAALNFHKRKAHPGDFKDADPSERVEQTKETVEPEPSRKKRGRPPMLKFGKLPGVRDYTKGPFKVSDIAFRLAEDKQRQVSTRSKQSISPILAEVEPENVETKPVKKTPNKRKNSSAELSTDAETNTPPHTSSSASPEMPVLTPPSSTSSGRSGLKRIKKGKHWKYNDDGDFSITNDIFPSAVVSDSEVSRRSNDSKSPESKSSPSSSRTKRADLNTVNNLLETAIEEKREKERLNNSSISLPSSIQENDQCTDSIIMSPKTDSSSVQPTRSTRNGRNRVQPKPKPTAQSGSVKIQVCPVCEKSTFRNSAHYINHLEIHEGKRPFWCPVSDCELGYETEVKLMEHVTIRHLQEAKFSCPNCGIEYKTQRGLEKHNCC